LSLLSIEYLLFLAFIALFTGFIKGGMPSLGALLSATVALVFPPRDALGITLIYLMIGDIAAVSLYWRLAHWQELKLMIMPVLAGILAGGLVLGSLTNSGLGLTLGLVILLLVLMEPIRPRLTHMALSHPGSARTL